MERLEEMPQLRVVESQESEDAHVPRRAALPDRASLTMLADVLGEAAKIAAGAPLDARSSRPDVLRVSLDGAQAEGEWRVQVVETAASARFVTAAVRTDEPLCPGSLVVTTARGRSVTIAIDERMTIQKLEERIEAAPIAARPSLVRSGDVAVLSLVAMESGLGAEGEDLEVVVQQAGVGRRLEFRRQRSGRRALIEVGGKRVWSNSNAFDEAIPGVRLVVQRRYDGVILVAVERDRRRMWRHLQEFQSLYRDVTATEAATDGAGAQAERNALRAELEEVRSQRDRALAALQHAGAGVVVTDKRGRVSYANPAYYELTRKTVGEVVGRPCEWLGELGVHSGADREFDRVLADSRRCVRATTRPVWKEGRVDGSVTLCTEITDLHESGQERDELLTLLTHEFRTPLTSIRGFTDLLLHRDYAPEKAREFLHVIRSEAARMSDLVTDFLALQRAGQSADTLDLDWMSIGQMLTEIYDVLQPIARQHELVLDADEGLPSVLIDERAVSHIVTNLVSNAVKYSDQGTTIRVCVRDFAGDVALEVHDEGIGIEPASVPRVFDRFYRAPGPQRDDVLGSGLGLTLVKRLAESMDARVDVESTLGVGSVFRVIFPAPNLRRAA